MLAAATATVYSPTGTPSNRATPLAALDTARRVSRDPRVRRATRAPAKTVSRAVNVRDPSRSRYTPTVTALVFSTVTPRESPALVHPTRPAARPSAAAALRRQDPKTRINTPSSGLPAGGGARRGGSPACRSSGWG